VKTIALFARRPVQGQAKTRLSPSLPPDLAAMLYRGMLADALSVARESGSDRVALYWTGDTVEAPAFDVPAGVDICAQAGADLGERLTAAFAAMLAGPGDRAVAIGADCPDLDPATVREAFAALDQHDVALGPASDGGYYLIGLRRPAPGLFRGVSWGTERVLAETLQGAAREGFSVHSLDTLSDLDTPEDLVRFVARRSVSAAGPGPRTEAALRDLGLLPAR
jgi:rSAM/selenodomain-associated transferase 1